MAIASIRSTRIVIPLQASDDDLIRIGKENPGFQVEREEDGTVLMSPTHTRTSSKCIEAAAQLRDYAKRVGGKAFGPDAGFAAGPGKRVRCPDASWASPQTIAAIPPAEFDGFWPVSPDVAIEVKSDPDDFVDTVAKVEMYRDRGSHYAVAIDPDKREVQERGAPPSGLQLDFDAIIDA
jgi:Uma2 family endonuclease